MRSASKTLRYLTGGVAVVSAGTLAGCDPVVNIAGANFPAWLFCVVAGAVLTAFLRLLFIALRIDQHLWLAPLVYLSLAVLVGSLVYAICFSRV